MPNDCVPQWIKTKGHMSMVSLRPRYPTLHMSAFRISESEECLRVKNWSKIVNDCREVLGGSKEKCNSSMMNQESYTCSMLFYLRGSNRSDLASSCSYCPELN